MKRMLTVTVLCLVAGLVGCSPMIEVSQKYDDEVDFSQVKTWAWVPKSAPTVPTMSGSAPDSVAADSIAAARNTLVNNTIRAAVEKSMEKIGLQKTSANPDVIVAYSFGRRTQIFIDDWGALYYQKVGWGEEQTAEDVSLMIDLVDPKSEELIWRGKAIVAPNTDPTPDIIERNVTKAVSKIFEQYPPGAHGGY